MDYSSKIYQAETIINKMSKDDLKYLCKLLCKEIIKNDPEMGLITILLNTLKTDTKN